MLLGYRLRAPLPQNNLGETVACVGVNYFFLSWSQQRDKINVNRDVVELYIFLLFCPLPIKPILWWVLNENKVNTIKIRDILDLFGHSSSVFKCIIEVSDRDSVSADTQNQMTRTWAKKPDRDIPSLN